MIDKNALIVIESPNKVKKLKDITGASVIATVGHFKDLPKNRLGLDIQTYEPEFVINGSRFAADIKRAAQGKTVYIATDPDREGYAIAMGVYEEIRGVATAAHRLEIHEITEKGVREAEAKAVPFTETNFALYDAFLGRRIGDRLAGFVLSPLASRALDGKFSVGRVQSPAVRLVVEREREIRGFKAESFWNVFLTLAKDGKTFQAAYEKKNLRDKREAEAVLADVSDAGRIMDVRRKQAQVGPKAPFTTVELQACASSQLGLAPERTMRLAQELFEKGLITYHRTDSTHLAEEFVAEARSFIAESFGADYLPAAPVVYRSKNSQAEAHEAIRPTHLHPLADIEARVSAESLTEDHARLYRLIFTRAVACQMAGAVYDTTSVDLDFGGRRFVAKGRILTFDGHLRLFQEQTEGEEEDDRQELPQLETGESVQKVKQELKEGKTKAPARYTEGALVKRLEALGIGRPSTYASIIKTIKERGYVEVSAKKLVPTTAGESVVDFLTDAHPWLVDYDMTRRMEDELDRVAAKQADWKEFVRSLHERMGFLDPDHLPAPKRPPFGGCPKCGGEVIEHPKTYACASCHLLIWKEIAGGVVPAAAAKELLANGQTSSELTFISKKTGKPFTAFLKLDEAGKVVFEFRQEEGARRVEKIGVCPLCGGDVVEGEKFFACKGCRLTIWKTVAGATITASIAQDLLKDRKTKTKLAMTSRAGKPFSARLVLTDAGDVEFE